MGKFIDELGNMGFGIATNAANGIVGGILGQAFAGANDRRQLRQQEKLQTLEMRGSKEMTDYNYGKQMQMWKDTNYSAQMAELSKAGLNPGLLYGMGGGGGATTGSGAGASVGGAKAAAVAGENVQMADRMMQLGLMQAQKRNIEADTSLKEAQAGKTSGVDTALANKQIESLTQGIMNQKAVERLTQLQADFEQVKASVARQTINEQMKGYEQMITKGEEEIRALKLANDLSQNQMDDKIKLLHAQALGEIIKNELNSKNIKYVESQIFKNSQDILQGWKDLNIKEKQQRTSQFLAEFQANHPGLMNVLGGAIQRFADNITSPLRGNRVNQ